MITEIKGNLLDTDCKVIAHGVNCQNAMGSGVAKVLYTKWPEVKKRYHAQFDKYGVNPEYYLGTVHKAFTNDKIILNCFTQQNYGYDGQIYLSYSALSDCFKRIFLICYEMGLNEVAIPKIGCGLAGGDWEIVKMVIDDTVPERFNVKVYYLDEKP